MNAAEQFGDAAERGDVEQASRLLADGIPVDIVPPARSDQRRTALDRAIVAEQEDMVRLLLDAGADPEQPVGIYREDTPVRYAAPRGLTEILRLLLAAGAAPDGPTHRRRGSALTMAALHHRGHSDIVTLLLDHGANPNQLHGEPDSPLEAAVVGGNPEIVGLLLDRGAVVTRQILQRAHTEHDRHPAAPPKDDDYTRIITMLERDGVAEGPLDTDRH